MQFIIRLRWFPLFGDCKWWCNEHWNADVCMKWGFYFLVDHLEDDFFFLILLPFPFLIKVTISSYSRGWLGTHYGDQTSLKLAVGPSLCFTHDGFAGVRPTLIWRFYGSSAPYWNFRIGTVCHFGICAYVWINRETPWRYTQLQTHFLYARIVSALVVCLPTIAWSSTWNFPLVLSCEYYPKEGGLAAM